ncbi:MAG: hypothetical protein VXX85_04485, partial [Candidatus Margulisiibacteriota bacterium]|nr:hypothetical protein [Candidatus Margulisiibacteriota bacterium]
RFNGLPYNTNPLVAYREYSFGQLTHAANTGFINTGMQLSFVADMFGLGIQHQKTVDYNKFNEIRDNIVGYGMNAQKSLMMMMSFTGYLSSLSKSIRGDGKVGAQHMGALIDVVEREITQDLDELGRIQSMQEQLVSLHNAKFDSARRIERSYYEMLFFGAYFIAGALSTAAFSVIDIIMVKAVANMAQGIMLSWNTRDDDLEDDELERYDYNKSNSGSAIAAGYGAGNSSSVDYSGIRNWETNYSDFSTKPSSMIFSSGYGNNWLTNSLGMGFKSVNYFEQAHQNMMLKKLFTQWNLILKSGQSVAEAYQSIADDLGASTSSLSYTSALKSQMNLKKSQMTKNIDNRFSLAGQVVNVFNAFQKERFETFQQFFKTALLSGLRYGFSRRNKLNSKDFNQGTKSELSLAQNAAIYNAVNYSEDLFRIGVAGVRREQINSQRESINKNAEAAYLSNFSAGSSAEAMLYTSNIKKAKQKVNSDIIGKVKYYDGFFKAVVLNLIDAWKKSAQDQGKKDLQGDGQYFKDQGAEVAKAMMSGDHKKAQRNLTEFSAFLTKSNQSNANRGIDFANNLIRSVKSMFSDQSKKSTGALSQHENSSSVWDSIHRTYRQMIKFGGVELADQFQDEMKQLESNINDFHTLNKSKINQSISLEQIESMQSIIAGFNRLDALAQQADDYNKDKASTMWKKLRIILNPHRTPLSALVKNIDHFAMYCSVGMAVELNSNLKKLSVTDQQKYLANMQFIQKMAQKDPKKVYQDLGEFFTRMSQHQSDVPKRFNLSDRVNDFIKTSLSYSLEDDADAASLNKQLKGSLKDFVTRFIAAKKHGANSTLEMLYSHDHSQADTVMNESDGIINQALDMGNAEGARRMLHPKYPKLQSLFAHFITTQGKAKQYAHALNQTIGADGDDHPHKLGEGAFSDNSFTKWKAVKPYTEWMGLSRAYSTRLQEVIDLAVSDVKSSGSNNPAVQKKKLMGLIEFAAELAKGDNKVSNKESASDYLFGRIKALGVHYELSDFDDSGIPLSSTVINGLNLDDSSNPLKTTISPYLVINPQETFDGSEHIESKHVKSALYWGLEQDKDNDWFKGLYNKHDTEFVHCLADMKPDAISTILNKVAGVNPLDDTTRFQLKVLGANWFIGHKNIPCHNVDWSQIKWPSSVFSETSSDFGLQTVFDNIKSDLSDQINKQHQKIFKTVPGVILNKLFFAVGGSNFLRMGGDEPQISPSGGDGPTQNTSAHVSLPTGGTNQQLPDVNDGTSAGLTAGSSPQTSLNASGFLADQRHPQVSAIPVAGTSTLPSDLHEENDGRSVDSNGLDQDLMGDVDELDSVGGAGELDLLGDVDKLDSVGGSDELDSLDGTTPLVDSNGLDQDLTGFDDVNGQPDDEFINFNGSNLSLQQVADLLNYQPDLAVKLLGNRHDSKLGNEFISPLARVLGWVMKPNYIVGLFERMNNDQKMQFVAQVLVQEDKAAETLFSLHPKAIDIVNQYPREFTKAQQQKAQFLSKGFSQSSFDSLSSTQREQLIGSGDTPIVVTKKEEVIKKELSQLFETINRKSYSNSISQVDLANMKQLKGELFCVQDLTPKLNELRDNLNSFDIKSPKSIKPVKHTIKSLNSLIEHDQLMGGDHTILIHSELKQFLLSTDVCEAVKKIKSDKDEGVIELQKSFMALYSQYAPQKMHQEFTIGNDSSVWRSDSLKRRAMERVQSLVSDSVLRHNSPNYRPVSELLTQFSLVPDSSKETVLSGIVDQFTSLCDNNQLASVTRMFDVVNALYNEYDQFSDLSEKAEIKKSVSAFLDKVVDSNVELSTQQQRDLLSLLNRTDVNQSFAKFFQLEELVGVLPMQQFLNSVHYETRQSTSFIMGVRARLTRHGIDEASIELTGNEPIFSDFSNLKVQDILTQLQSKGVLDNHGKRLKRLQNGVDLGGLSRELFQSVQRLVNKDPYDSTVISPQLLAEVMNNKDFKQTALTPFVNRVNTAIAEFQQNPQPDISSYIDNKFQDQIEEVRDKLKGYLPDLKLLDQPIDTILGSEELVQDLTSLHQTSTADFRSIIVKMVQQGKHLDCLDKLLKQGVLNNPDNHPMLHEFYNICANDMGKHSFEREFFKRLSNKVPNI